MRLCFITEYFPTGSSCDIRGGAEVVAFYEAKYLARDHDINVITSCEPGTKREDVFDNIKVFRCGRIRNYVQLNAFADRISFIRSAYLFGKKQEYDLVVGFSIITYPVAWTISKKLKIPCIIRYHDVLVGRWIKNFGLTGIIGELFERYTLSRNFAAFIAVSNYTANNLKKYIRDKEKIYVVHNGVEVPEITVTKSQNPTIACVSRLVKYKHTDDLINALGLIIKDFPDLQCKIIGTGFEEEKLRQLATQTGVAEHVTFLGFVKDHMDVLRIVKSSHVFCLPSSLEGFGIVIIEAMACGVPFVATDIAPILEVSERKGGLIYKCRDVGDLAEKLKIILGDIQLQNRLIDEGLKRAQEFHWSNISAKSEVIYKKILSEWCHSKD
jgi:glycosyltransferase involved in cell wall biosynthesis